VRKYYNTSIWQHIKMNNYMSNEKEKQYFNVLLGFYKIKEAAQTLIYVYHWQSRGRLSLFAACPYLYPYVISIQFNCLLACFSASLMTSVLNIKLVNNWEMSIYLLCLLNHSLLMLFILDHTSSLMENL